MAVRVRNSKVFAIPGVVVVTKKPALPMSQAEINRKQLATLINHVMVNKLASLKLMMNALGKNVDRDKENLQSIIDDSQEAMRFLADFSTKSKTEFFRTHFFIGRRGIEDYDMIATKNTFPLEVYAEEYKTLGANSDRIVDKNTFLATYDLPLIYSEFYPKYESLIKKSTEFLPKKTVLTVREVNSLNDIYHGLCDSYDLIIKQLNPEECLIFRQ